MALELAEVVRTIVRGVGERYTKHGKIKPCALVVAGEKIHVVPMDEPEEFLDRIRREAEIAEADAVAVVREAWVSKPGEPAERIEAIVVYVETPSQHAELVCPIVRGALFPMLGPAVEVPATPELTGFFAHADAQAPPPSDPMLE